MDILGWTRLPDMEGAIGQGELDSPLLSKRQTDIIRRAECSDGPISIGLKVLVLILSVLAKKVFYAPR